MKITKSNLYFAIMIFLILFNSTIEDLLPLMGFVCLVLIVMTMKVHKLNIQKDWLLIYMCILSLYYLLKVRSLGIITYTVGNIVLFMCFYIWKYLLKRNQKKIVDFVLLIGAGNFWLCIVELLLHRNFVYDILGITYYGRTVRNGSYRVSGICDHPIINASFSLVLLFLSLMMRNRFKGKKYDKYVYMNLIVLLLTLTRSAHLTVIVLGLISGMGYLVRKRKTIKKDSLIVIFSLIAVSVVTLILSSRARGSFNTYVIGRYMELFSNATNGSYRQRIGSINWISGYFNGDFEVSMLIGHGYGRLIKYLYTNKIYFVDPSFYAVDNQYVTFLYDIGIINFVLILFLILKLLVKIHRVRSSKQNAYRDLKYIELIVLGIMMMLFFFEFTNRILLLVIFSLPFALVSNYFEGEYNWNRSSS